MFNLINFLAVESDAGTGGGNWWIWIVLLVAVVVMFVMPMFTGRKRQKEVNELYDSLEVGDEVMTVGGVMGKIVDLTTHESGEKLMVVETGEGENKTTMTFVVQALKYNYTKIKLRQEQLAKEKAEREAAKNKKKNADTTEGVASENDGNDAPIGGEETLDVTESEVETETQDGSDKTDN